MWELYRVFRVSELASNALKHWLCVSFIYSLLPTVALAQNLLSALKQIMDRFIADYIHFFKF